MRLKYGVIWWIINENTIITRNTMKGNHGLTPGLVTYLMLLFMFVMVYWFIDVDWSGIMFRISCYLAHCIQYNSYKIHRIVATHVVVVFSVVVVHKLVFGGRVLRGYVFAINLLRATFNQHKHTYVFTMCIIPPYWYDTGSWNPFSWMTRTYPFGAISVMGADVLSTSLNRCKSRFQHVESQLL